MQILTDTGADFLISDAEQQRLNIHVIPQMITLNGQSYRSGVDIQLDELYQLFETTPGYPTTSLPSTGDFVELYRRMAREDPDILSIHVSGALSGTLNAAATAARLVPEARVTLVDSRSVSIVQGWQVTAAARAIQAGLSREHILALIARIEANSTILFTLKDLEHIIHGGRVSHLRGMVASALQIKPLLGIDRVSARLIQVGMARTFHKAVEDLAKLVTRQHPSGSELSVVVGHTHNFEGARLLHQHMDALFHCRWMPDFRLSAVLGAHGGPTLVGMAFGRPDILADLAS